MEMCIPLIGIPTIGVDLAGGLFGKNSTKRSFSFAKLFASQSHIVVLTTLLILLPQFSSNVERFLNDCRAWDSKSSPTSSPEL